MYESVMAGICISIGCIANLKASDPVVGAFLFSIGLLSVIHLGFWLYTGKVSDPRWAFNPIKLGLCFIFNLMGCALMSFPACRLEFVRESAQILVIEKENRPILTVFISAVLCGILISIAVSTKKQLIIILSVMTFILIGAEHVIADAFYMFVAGDIDPIFLAVVYAGNYVGGLLFLPVWMKKYHKRKEENKSSK